VTGGKWLDNIRNMNDTSLCGYMTMITAISDAIMALPVAKLKFPFSGSTFGQIYDKMLKGALADAKSKVCDKAQLFPMSALCDRLAIVFKKEVCTTRSITIDGMSLGIHVPLEAHIDNQFEMDIMKLFGGNLPKCIGHEGSGNSSLQAALTLDLSLVAQFMDNGHPKLSIHPNLAINGNVHFTFNGQMKVNFGVLAATLQGMLCFMFWFWF
jgi:hypothetical protein